MAFLHQDTEFFDMLERQSDAALRAAREFQTLGADICQARTVLDKLSAIESEADTFTHRLVAKTDSKFITPFDKEDLHRLSVLLDDLTDHVEATAARIAIYRITSLRPDFPRMTELIVQAMEATHNAVRELRNLKNLDTMQRLLITIHSVEEASDRAYRQALDTLFGEPDPDPLNVMKWKEIYDRVEVTVDSCEDVADMLETMAVKYG